MEEFHIIRVGKLISMASGKFTWLQKQIYKCTEKNVAMKNSTQGICSKSMLGINHLIGTKSIVQFFQQIVIVASVVAC
jgi:hypothetical protein